MINRNSYDETIASMVEINSHHSGKNITSGLAQIDNTREKFDIKLMIVGHFSAGKSSLLNALLGKPGFLKEAQEPQTALATEIIYDENESMFAYDLNGNKEEYNSTKEYSLKQYNHLEYRLNIPILKEISDFTIVDTPGFDSGIEAHAKALANYIDIGSAYIVVIDQEKGGIDQTTLDFIQEISNYSHQIAVLINKCDKITTETAESIAESARFTLAIHGLPYKVYTISRRDDDVVTKLVSIISGFDPQLAFDRVISQQIKTELLNMEKVLSVTKKKIYLDTFDLDANITLYTRLEEQLAGTFDNKREEVEENIDNMVQKVIDNIRGALISRADGVAEALLSGNQVAAEAIVVETIRPIMVTTMKEISTKQIDDMIGALDFTGLVNESEGSDLIDVAVNLAANLKGLIEQGEFNTKRVPTIENVDKKKNIYRTITGISAITTALVPVWCEVIIFLLPDIINLLHNMFGESNVELTKRRFVNNVVPQVINKIYPNIKQNIDITTKLVLDEYEKMLNEKIESVKDNMIEAQNKKNQKVEEFEKYKVTLSNDMEKIKKLINELRVM